MFGSYENTSSCASDSDSLSSYFFLGNFQELMADNDVKYTSVEDFKTIYIGE